MRILIIGINYSPEIISTAIYTTGLAEYLAENGHHIRVITALPYYPQWEVLKGWKGYTTIKSNENLTVTHCPLYVPKNPSGIKRILHHISFALCALPIAIKATVSKPDLVMVIAPSLLSAPVGWLAAKISRSKLWLHIQDLEVDAAFATGLIKNNSILGKAALAYEKWAIKRFDKVSTLSQNMIAKLISKNIPQSKTYELRNWADLQKVYPYIGVSPLRSELKITTKFVALYSGNMAMKQGLELLPKIAATLEHRSDLTFVFCGDGPMRKELEENSIGLSNVIFANLQPIDRLNELMGMADIHLLPQIAQAADLVLPSKLTNMLASGRPIVATAEPNTALYFEITDAGFAVPSNDHISAAAAIEEILDDTAIHQIMSKRAREKAENNWEKNAILARLEKEFGALIGENR
jgi:colanic acid biosynthesis glycosyl transferase WcaI